MRSINHLDHSGREAADEAYVAAAVPRVWLAGRAAGDLVALQVGLISSLQWQPFDPILDVFHVRGQRDQFQILDETANGNSRLMRVDHAGEWRAVAHALRRLHEEVFVVSNQRPRKFGGSIEQERIVKRPPAILLSGDGVYGAKPQSASDGGAGMFTSM